jgi:hypothetical protein
VSPLFGIGLEHCLLNIWWSPQAEHCWFARFLMTHNDPPDTVRGRILNAHKVRFPHY